MASQTKPLLVRSFIAGTDLAIYRLVVADASGRAIYYNSLPDSFPYGVTQNPAKAGEGVAVAVGRVNGLVTVSGPVAAQEAVYGGINGKVRTLADGGGPFIGIAEQSAPSDGAIICVIGG